MIRASSKLLLSRLSTLRPSYLALKTNSQNAYFFSIIKNPIFNPAKDQRLQKTRVTYRKQKIELPSCSSILNEHNSVSEFARTLKEDILALRDLKEEQLKKAFRSIKNVTNNKEFQALYDKVDPKDADQVVSDLIQVYIELQNYDVNIPKLATFIVQILKIHPESIFQKSEEGRFRMELLSFSIFLIAERKKLKGANNQRFAVHAQNFIAENIEKKWDFVTQGLNMQIKMHFIDILFEFRYHDYPKIYELVKKEFKEISKNFKNEKYSEIQWAIFSYSKLEKGLKNFENVDIQNLDKRACKQL